MAEWRADWRRDEAAGWPVANTLNETLPAYGFLMQGAFNQQTQPDNYRPVAPTQPAN
jgi:hypothetical protein